MSKIGYGYDSEWHMLRYLGYHRNELNQCIAAVTGTGAADVEWLDFPFASMCDLLRDDREYTGLEFLANANVMTNYKTYWPPSGTPPTWDAVGRIRCNNGQQEWVFVEAKAHIGELITKCGATSVQSNQMIQCAFDDTAQKVSLQKTTTLSWFQDYYQYANRLAILNFLQNVCIPAIPSRLIFVYFYGERQQKFTNSICPDSAAAWSPYLIEMYQHLDIDLQAPLIQRAHTVFLPVNPKCPPNQTLQRSTPLQKLHRPEQEADT